MRNVFLLLVFLSIAGCSSTQSPDKTVLNQNSLSSNFYLRGDMTNWDALPEYVAHPISHDIYIVDIKLSANHIYHLKFADRDWKPESNFGALGDSKELIVASSVVVKAGSCMDELTFEPDVDGFYRFTLDLTHQIKTVSVSQK